MGSLVELAATSEHISGRSPDHGQGACRYRGHLDAPTNLLLDLVKLHRTAARDALSRKATSARGRGPDLPRQPPPGDCQAV